MASDGRLLLVCGETSGDLYAGDLLRELRTARPSISAYGLGGDRAAAAGLDLVGHVRDVAVVGIWEVVSHLGRLRALFREILARVDRERPDAAVLVDYPDFNLRLAAELKKRDIPVVYYVSPQLWAWRRGRIHAIARTVAQMLVIFPFEVSLYQSAGVPVDFVGHPLVDHVHPPRNAAAFRAANGLDPNKTTVALLPGSRPKEVAHNLPTLLDAGDLLLERHADLQLILAAAPHLDDDALKRFVGKRPVTIVKGQTHAALAISCLGLIASGTATVEAALLGVPMVVVYRVSPLTYALGRPLVRVPHFAMVNLIAGRRVVPELIQRDFTAERVLVEGARLLEDSSATSTMRTELAAVAERLGGPGASARAARIVDEIMGRKGE